MGCKRELEGKNEAFPSRGQFFGLCWYFAEDKEIDTLSISNNEEYRCCTFLLLYRFALQHLRPVGMSGKAQAIYYYLSLI
jgi:hypothetical protein